ncbi:MAG: hypothetical protein WAM82_34695, partial [Thermoanaerobaculia bacterium]
QEDGREQATLHGGNPTPLAPILRGLLNFILAGVYFPVFRPWSLCNQAVFEDFDRPSVTSLALR